MLGKSITEKDLNERAKNNQHVHKGDTVRYKDDHYAVVVSGCDGFHIAISDLTKEGYRLMGVTTDASTQWVYFQRMKGPKQYV